MDIERTLDIQDRAHRIAQHLDETIRSDVFRENPDLVNKLTGWKVIYSRISNGELDRLSPAEKDLVLLSGDSIEQRKLRKPYESVMPLMEALEGMRAFVQNFRAEIVGQEPIDWQALANEVEGEGRPDPREAAAVSAEDMAKLGTRVCRELEEEMRSTRNDIILQRQKLLHAAFTKINGGEPETLTAKERAAMKKAKLTSIIDFEACCGATLDAMMAGTQAPAQTVVLTEDGRKLLERARADFIKDRGKGRWTPIP